MGRNADREMRTGRETGEGGDGRRADVLQRHFEWRCKIAVQFSFRGENPPARVCTRASARARGGKRVYTASTFSAWPRDWS